MVLQVVPMLGRGDGEESLRSVSVDESTKIGDAVFGNDYLHIGPGG